MPHTSFTRWRTLLPLACALAASLSVSASGGGDDESVLATVSHYRPEPEAMKGYLHGHLGVLWTSYDRDVLIMAYRIAKGLPPVSAEDEKSLTAPPSPAPSPDAAQDNKYAPEVTGWMAARQKLGLPPPGNAPSGGSRDTGNYTSSSNCSPDAFTLAAQTLADRQRQHASDADAIKQWVAGQDAVFSHCDNTAPIALQPLPAKAPTWLVKDRAYQEAAVLLYTDAGSAEAAFDKIAADTASPWREWADYLSMRAWWRQNFKDRSDYDAFIANTPDWDKSPIVQRLARIRDKARDPAVRNAARGIYDAMHARFDPKLAFAEHWRQIEAKEPPPDMDAWVSDERWYWALLPEQAYQQDWLYQTRSLGAYWSDSGRDATLLALIDQWQSKHEPIRLASALAVASPSAPHIDDMLAASKKIQPDDPLYVHFAFQRTRLALAKRDHAGARAELDKLTPTLKGEAEGTRQAFDQLAMLAAPSLQAVSQHLLRKPLGHDEIWEDQSRFNPTLTKEEQADTVDSDTASWLANQLNGQELLQLAHTAALPLNIRKQLAGEAWYDGAFSGDAELEKNATQLWANLSKHSDIERAAKAAAPDEARFLMARTMLLGQNDRMTGGVRTTREMDKPHPASPYDPVGHWNVQPAFHDASAQTSQTTLVAQLAKANETTWMGKQILPWLGSQPKFAEGPAILEKLVYASRYRQHDTTTSRAAFQLLHKQYPSSPEAQRTRYYY